MQDITIPIRLDGAVRGRLEVTQQGLMTVFSAWCENPGRLVRLSVFGNGQEGYLGVMVPGESGLMLTKKLSREELRHFPDTLEYAAEAGTAPAVSPRQQEKTENAAPPRIRERPQPSGRPAEPMALSRGSDAPRNGERGTELLWYQTGDGSLYTTWQGRSFRAIPMSAWGLPTERILEKRQIDGVEYAVFELRNGKII